jgi:hypothetical protein
MSELPLPDKKYNIIYADPAWNFKIWSKKGNKKSASQHYNIMNIKDIKELPVKDIADKNCILLMWVTYPNLLEGINLGLNEDYGKVMVEPRKGAFVSVVSQIKRQVTSQSFELAPKPAENENINSPIPILKR